MSKLKRFLKGPYRFGTLYRLVSMNIFITEEGERNAEPFIVIWNFKTGEEIKRLKIDYLLPNTGVLRPYEIIVKWPWLILILREDNVGRARFLGKFWDFQYLAAAIIHTLP